MVFIDEYIINNGTQLSDIRNLYDDIECANQPVWQMLSHKHNVNNDDFKTISNYCPYRCLLLILMLWHRQAIFESKGDR